MGCFVPHVALTIVFDSQSTIVPVSLLCGAIVVVTVVVVLGRSMPHFRELTRAYAVAKKQRAEAAAGTPGGEQPPAETA